MYEISGDDLRTFLADLDPLEGITMIRIDARESGIAIKVNELGWSREVGTLKATD